MSASDTIQSNRLFMLLLGCKPAGRLTEQHDIFFGIAEQLADLVPAIQQAWPGVSPIHIDAWREVTRVDGYKISVTARETAVDTAVKLFFLNLGGYKKDAFEEFHYKLLTVSPGKAAAITQAKDTAFFRHCGFKGATSHIDDKYGVDVDDLYEIPDILPENDKKRFALQLARSEDGHIDEWHLGYTKLSSLTRTQARERE